MDKELEKYYESYFDLFSRPGWKQFEEELNDALDTLKSDLETAPETKGLQGQIKEVRFFLNFRSAITNAYDQLKEADKEEQE